MNDASRAVRLIPFGPRYRASGVLLHIPSLSSPYGIGDLGPAAFAMVDRLQAAGRSRHYWHVFVPGIDVGQIYAYRVDGSYAQGARVAI